MIVVASHFRVIRITISRRYCRRLLVPTHNACVKLYMYYSKLLFTYIMLLLLLYYYIDIVNCTRDCVYACSVYLYRYTCS